MLSKLLDVYIENNDWPHILGCWEEMIKVNSNNVGARYGRLKYLYILSNSSGGGAWQEVYDLCKEAILKAKDAPNGYILMAGCEVPVNAPGYNLFAMKKAVMDYGFYD